MASKPQSTKASVSVAIIARNASKTIAACVRSLVEHVAEVVVCVDATTTDDTARVARKAGARVVTGLPVSEWHECPAHGKVRVQHFALARDWSFAQTRPDTEWLMWVDADDIVKGAERLPEFIARIPAQVDVVWLPYHYATAPNGATSTLFDRERLLRRSVGWQWQFRVHEIAQPVGRPMESLGMLRSDEIQIWHADKKHDTAGSARRNITLLEIDLEENIEDKRAWFYLGNQWFALGEWTKAAESYLRALEHDNVYQLWQTYIYLSMTFEKLGDLDQAKAMTYQAIDVAPYHPEPYYRLAALDGLLRNDLQRAEFWTKLGDQMVEAPNFAFRNPLDRTFNARVTLANAYALNGFASRARRELEMAAQAVPAPEVLEGIERHKAEERDILQADAVVAALGPRIKSISTSAALEVAAPVWHVGRVRDLVIPNVLRARPNTQPRIVFMCGRSAEPWAPPSIETTGIGGSETAVIQIAKRFARDGWRVDVYNDPDKYEGVHEEVGYWGNSRFGEGEHADVLVSWRQPGFVDLPIDRRMSLLWMHDLHAGPGADANLRRWDTVLGVSAWHAAYLSQVYGIGSTAFVPNGIDLERFTPRVKKVPFRSVYASSPDRGLDRLLDLWPHIVETEPTAELHVAYGWETIERYAQMGMASPQLLALKAKIEEQLKNTPRVVWRGRLNQKDLAQLYSESYAWLYPTSFTEVSCISAMEAMAGGAVPVTSAVGALPETIGEAGVIVTGNTYSPAWKEFWIACAKAVLLSPPERKPREAKGRERVQGLTWDKAFEKWLEVVGEVQPAAPKRLLEVVK